MSDADVTVGAIRAIYRRTLEQTGLFAAVAEVPSNPLRLDVRTRSGQVVNVDLTNTVADAARTPQAEWPALVAQRAKATLDTARLADGTLAPPTPDMVVPTIKNKAWVDSAPKDVATEPLVADLFVAYAYDRKDSLTYARWPDLDKMGVARPALRQTAIINLRTRLPPQLSTRGDGKSLMLVAGGNFEASLILLDDVWNQLGASRKGDLVVCLLARDVCLVTSTDTPEGIASLKAARERLCNGGTPSNFISKTLLQRRRGVWGPCQL
jgi:uncharacterized protein YtpQ (UPF0354 family)